MPPLLVLVLIVLLLLVVVALGDAWRAACHDASFVNVAVYHLLPAAPDPGLSERDGASRGFDLEVLKDLGDVLVAS